MCKEIYQAEKQAPCLGIRFKTMTVYRAELTHLRSEGYKDKEIAEIILDSTGIVISSQTVNGWYNESKQPKDIIIEALEKRVFKRIEESNIEIFDPKNINNIKKKFI